MIFQLLHPDNKPTSELLRYFETVWAGHFELGRLPRYLSRHDLMADIFISYSHRDKERADEVVSRIAERGWTVWIDDGLRGDDEFRSQIQAALTAARVVLVLWSEHSIGSDWCRDEADFARGCKPPKLMAARLDDVLPPLGMRQMHAVGLLNLRPGEPHPGMDTLLGQLTARLERSEPAQINLHADAYRRLQQRLREARTSLLLGLGLALATIYFLAFDSTLVPSMRLLSLEARHAFSKVTPTDNLRVVVIDHETEKVLANKVGAAQFGRTWRTFHARVVERLVAAGAKVIAFDIAFASPPVEDRNNIEWRGSAEFAQSLTAARKAKTAVFVIARDRVGDALAVEPGILGALKEDLPTLGGVAHPCMGEQEGWANLAPLVFTEPGKTPGAPVSTLFSLDLVSYAAFVGQSPSWDAEAKRLTRGALGQGATNIPFTGLDRELDPEGQACKVAIAGQRPVQRVLEPFAQDLDPKAQGTRAIKFEHVLFDDKLADVAGKIVLVGVQLTEPDRHKVCSLKGCLKVAGLALHATAIDTLFRDQVISVIPPLLQLVWVLLFCVAVAWQRFAGARSSARYRFGWLAGLMVLDVLLAVYLGAVHAVLVDSLHHLLAMAATYYLVARIEPAVTERARSLETAAAP